MYLDKGASGGSTDDASDNHAPPPMLKLSEVAPEPMLYLPDDILLLPNLNNLWEDDVLFLNMIWDYSSSFYAPSMPFQPPPNSLEAAIMKMEVDQPEDHNNNDKVENDNNEAVVVNDKNDNNEAVVVNEVVVDDQNDSDKDNVVNDNNEVVTLTAVVDPAGPLLDPSLSGGVNDETDHKNNEEVANISTGGEVKRKRGRPRKTPIEESVVPVSSELMATQSGDLLKLVKNEGTSLKKRGRGSPPRRSDKKRKAAATISRSHDISGSAGSGFVPHIITVRSEEDVLGRLLSFAQVNKQAVCVLLANGTISNVALQQSSSSGGTVTYQGPFEILSLSGSFLPSELGGQRSSTGGLSVSLAGPDGRVLGGGVAGLLTAASDVQIIVGTFLAAGQQSTRSGCKEVYIASPKHISLVGESPPSGATLSESSGGSGSPFSYST